VAIFYNIFLLPAVGLADQPLKGSKFDQPQELYALYDRDSAKLSKRQRWLLRKHGMRHAPLDARLWGVRRFDKLDNRLLVSIRPFYLRLSEHPDVRLSELEFDFAFHATSYNEMALSPHTRVAMLEIGFAGRLEFGHSGQRLPVDRGYAARLSGHFDFPSGIFFRSHRKSVQLASLAEPVISTGGNHHLLLKFTERFTVLFVDGKEVARIAGEKLDRGLLSLTVGWHPLVMKHLKVRGSKIEKGKRIAFEVSGLHKVDN